MYKNHKVIVVAAGNETDLVRIKEALGKKYIIFGVPSSKTLFPLLNSVKADLILLDAEMPGMNGRELINALKSTGGTAHIPVIMLTKPTRRNRGGFAAGTVSSLVKPFSRELLLNRIEETIL